MLLHNLHTGWSRPSQKGLSEPDLQKHLTFQLQLQQKCKCLRYNYPCFASSTVFGTFGSPVIMKWHESLHLCSSVHSVQHTLRIRVQHFYIFTILNFKYYSPVCVSHFWWIIIILLILRNTEASSHPHNGNWINALPFVINKLSVWVWTHK
jgi:flagellar biosynthesis protein FliP